MSNPPVFMESAAEKNIISNAREIANDVTKRNQLKIVFDANGFALLLFALKSCSSSGKNKISLSKLSTPTKILIVIG